MANKEFKIQSDTVSLNGVLLSSSVDGKVVIPGVTRSTGYRVEEVEDTDDQTYSNFPAESEVVVVDAALYNAIVNDLDESHFADYTATTDDDGEIDEIEVNGRGTYTEQEANTARNNDMYAYVGSSSASDRPLVPEDWIQVPFRPKMKSTGIESDLGGSGGSGTTLVNGDWEATLTDSGTLRVDNADSEQNYFKLTSIQNENDTYGVMIDVDNQAGWTFLDNGNIQFPDGSIQTTAYTGQSGGSSASTLYVAVNNDGRAFTSTDGLSWTEYTTSMTNVGRVAVGPNMIVYTATAVDASNGEEESLWYATTSAPGTVTEVTGFSDFTLNQVKYFANIEKFVAIGNNSNNLPVILYSSNGVDWTQVDLDNGFLAAFDSGAGFQSNAEFTDIETNGTGFLLTTSNNNLGAFYTTDITTSMGQANWIDFSGFGLEWGFNRIAFAAAGNFYGWHIMQNESDTDDAWYYNNNTNPTSGAFTEFTLSDIGSNFAESVNYQPQVSEVVFGAYNGITTIMIATDDGQILYWPAIPDGPFVSIPKPYTATDFDITQASTAAITFGNKSANLNEKIVLSNCTPSEYNGTYYVGEGNILYDNAGVSIVVDTSGWGSFESGTLTFSHGQYIDALHHSNGVFYAGNDDEEMFVSTNGGATWIQTTAFDGSPGEPEYMNDIDSYVSSGSVVDTGDVTFSTNVVEGSEWELGLSPGPDFTTGAYTSGNGDFGPQYFRVRGGDNYEHLHFDTTDNNAFDLYIGDDDTYFKLSKNGQAVIGTEMRTEPYDRHTWTFGIDGSLTFPDGSVQTSAGGGSSLSPELTKSDGTLIANAPIQFGESNSGLIAVVDSGGNDGQWFNYSVGDADGVMYACGTNDANPQYVWAVNSDGTVKWKVGIDDIDGYDVVPRTLTIDGDYLVVGVTYYTLATEEREIGVILLSLADGTVNSSYTVSTNNIGTKRIRAFALGPEGSHIIAGSLDGETIPENNITPNRETWGSNINILTVANSSLSEPIVPWSYNLEVQNDPQDVNAWYSPDSINYFRDLTVTSVTGTGGPQNYNIDNNYALGKLQLVVSDSGTTTILRLDATWVDGAAQTHLLAQNGAYSYTIVCSPGTYVAGQTDSWVDVGGGIYEAPLSVSGIVADGTYDITSLVIEKSVMTVELRYVPAGLTNGSATGGMIDAYNIQQIGQGYDTGDVVKVLGSQMGGIDTITLTGTSWTATNNSVSFLIADYPGFSVVQNGWRMSGPGIDGWATLSEVQNTGATWRFDVPQGIILEEGQQYTIDNNGNDIVFSLFNYGGGSYAFNSEPAGKVADAVAATTRIIMSQGVDYRGTENTSTYTAGTDYTIGTISVVFNNDSGNWLLGVDEINTDIIALLQNGDTLTDVNGVGNTININSEPTIEAGSYIYVINDPSAFVGSGQSINNFTTGNGTYTGTWNLRRGLNSQAFIIADGWSHTFGSGEWEQFSSVVYDSFDNSIYALGEFYNGDNEIALFKFDPSTGDTTWVKYVEDNEGDGSNAGTVAVDGTGNVYTCATNNNGDTIVTKLDSTGTLVWQVKQSNSDYWNNQPSLVLDSNGDIIVGGSYDNQNDPINTHYLWSFMKLSKVDGSLIWARYLDNQEKYAMYDMEDYDIQPMSVQGDDIYYAGMAYDTNDNYYVALSFKFNTSGAGLGTYDRWIWSEDENAVWADNTSNAVVTDAIIIEVDQTTFTVNSGSISVTADEVGSVTPAGYVLGGEGKLLFVDGSELTTAGIARHSLDSGDNSVWLNASMNGKFRFYANNPGGDSSTIYVPTNANVPLPIGFTLTVVIGDFNGSRVYVNNDGNSDVHFIVSGNDSFSTNYWQFNANTNAAGVYTIMKVDTDTWMLAGPDITID